MQSSQIGLDSRRFPVRGRSSGAGDVLVLCYHAVSADWDCSLAVTPQALHDQLQYLLSKGYRGATFTEAATGDHRGRVVAVTFDDGYRSVGELARPILDRLGVPATIYVPTRFIGTETPMSWSGIDEWAGTPHEQELMPMSWEELRELSDSGWEIGSHTLSHPHLTTLADDALRTELVESRQECEQMIGDCRSIAFPYGDCDARVIDASRDAGYEAVATIPWRLEQSGRFVWPRTGIFHDDSARVFRIKVSPLLRRLRASRLSSPLAPLVHLIRGGLSRDEPSSP